MNTSTAQAPSVRYPVGRSRMLGALLICLWGVGALIIAIGICWAGISLTGLHVALLLLAPMISAAGAFLFWMAQRPRRLFWDGAGWTLESEANIAEATAEDAVQVRLDAQRFMLLRYVRHGGDRGAWLWAECSTDPARWLLLRCALYSSAHSSLPDLPNDAIERA